MSKPTMDLQSFLRIHALRAPNVMWFLGAGASAGAGVATALNMVWDFKRTLYSAREKVSLRALGDVGDPSVRRRLQQYFDRTGSYPPEGAPEEYAAYFEATYPTEADRRLYIQARVEGASPSFGHYALAALMKAGRVRGSWSTNFDRLVEDAAAQVFGTTSALTVAALGEPEVARHAMEEGRWPFLGKLHGDFHSRRLKNVEEELRAQDIEMRRAMIEGCRRFGLAVVGYSGRDGAILDCLADAVEMHGFPAGLFWFHRGDEAILPRVRDLVDVASSAGVEASLIQLETFDELMSDMILLENKLPDELVAFLDSKRPVRVTNIALPAQPGGWPVLRLNALPVRTWPTACTLVRCSIGGAAQVRRVAADAGQIVAGRRKAGVICFGRDEDVRNALSPFTITEMGVYAIEPKRLRYGDSADLALLYDALGLAIARERPLLFFPRARKLVVDPARAASQRLDPLRGAVKDVVGTVPGSQAMWSEAAYLRLEYRYDQLWLLVEPTIWVHRESTAPRDETAIEFVSRRLATRYNNIANGILDAWVALIFGDAPEADVSAFGITDGLDAPFTLSRVTAFSRRSLQ